MALENRYIINYDIKTNTVTNAKFKQGDVDSSVLEIHLFDNGSIVNITGETIEFRFLKPDETVVYQDSTSGVTVLDAINGKIECVLKSNTLACAGEVICEIHRTKDGKILTTPRFVFTVEESISGDGVVSENYIGTIETISIQHTSIMKKQFDIWKWQNAIHDNSFENLIIDILMDESGIDKAKSTEYIYKDYTLQTKSTSTIVWNVFASDTIPTSVYVCCDYSGTVPTLSVSRDGGTTYTNCTLDTIVDISSQPSGSNIVLKVTLTGDCIINAVGCGWL